MRQDVIGRRIVAALIDVALVVVAFVAVALVVGEAEAGRGEARADLEGLPAALFITGVLVYYWVTEAVWGRTLGKALAGVRVVRADGSGRPPGVQGAFLRTILRPIDSLPALYLLGFVVAMATGPERRQRIGDLVAKTYVVDDRDAADGPEMPAAG